ncbi:MAG: ATP-binding protein [Cyanobacteria bacterium P01_E01_bin.42]
MNNFWQTLISPHHYIPHGHCYLWQTPLVGLHASADFAIAFSYYCIPLMLIYFIRQREDVPFRGLFVLFGAFIITCGTTHFMAIWTLWYPHYWLAGIVKVITAIVSLYTVLELFPAIPQALALPSPSQLQQLNQDLKQQILDRRIAEEQVRQLNQDLEERVAERTQTLQEVNRKLECEIEERKALTQKLSFSETYIRSILEAITDIILVLDEQCRVVEIPPTRSVLTAETEENPLIDRTVEHVLRSDRVAEYQEKVRQVLATQEPLALDYSLGEESWFSASIAPISSDRAIWIARDISPRKQMEFALRQSEARNRGIVAAIPDLMLCIDRNGNYLDYIPAKYTPELLCSDRVGKQIAEVLPESVARLQMQAIAQALDNQELQVYEQQIEIGNCYYDEEVRIAPSGENEVLVIVRNINEKKEAELALFEQMRLASLDSEIGIALTRNQDLQETLEGCAWGLARNLNTALAGIWSIEGEIFKQQAIAGENYILEEYKGRLHEEFDFDLVLAQKQPYICNTSIDEEIICCPSWLRRYGLEAIAMYPLFVGEKAIGILLLCDRQNFSDTILQALNAVANSIALGMNRHLANIALQQAAEAAEAANLAKSQFLSAMSHELRTPLNVIIGFSQILHQDDTLPKDQREFIDAIERSGEHLLHLIDDILSMSRIETGQVALEEKVFSLDLLLDNLYGMFQFQTQAKGIQFSLDRSLDLPSAIVGDESKLRQILINLLGNAIKFTQEGSISLSVTSYQLLTQRPTLPKRGGEEGRSPLTPLNKGGKEGRIANNQIHFEVRDTGEGIAPEELPRIFESFMQSESGRKSGQGTGLGLTLTRKFVELMGGEMTVNSRSYLFSPHSQQLSRSEGGDSETVGTIFSLILPFQLTEQSPSIDRPKPIALAPNQPIYRILIVEDNRQNRLLLRSLLIPLGFELAEAENGEIAVTLWQEWQPHLILMDMKMPIVEGDEATRQIRSREKEQDALSVRIVALTASVFDRDLEQMLASGCDAFLSKPFQRTILLETMGKLLGIRYLYEESAIAETEQPPNRGDREISLEMLATLPDEWLAEFYQVASVADEEGMRAKVAEIPEDKAALARSLSTFLDDFRADLIFESVKAVLSK